MTVDSKIVRGLHCGAYGRLVCIKYMLRGGARCCTVCGRAGHNRRTCPALNDDTDTSDDNDGSTTPSDDNEEAETSTTAHRPGARKSVRLQL